MPVRTRLGYRAGYRSGASVRPGEVLQQQLGDAVAPPAAHHEDGVALAHVSSEPGRRLLDAPGRHRPVMPGRRARTAAASSSGDVTDVSRSRLAQMLAIGDRVGLGEGIGEVARASRRSGGTSAARRRPRRADPARAGGAPRAWRGSRSDGGRSRRRPRRRAPRPSARGGARCPESSRAPRASRSASSRGPGSVGRRPPRARRRALDALWSPGHGQVDAPRRRRDAVDVEHDPVGASARRRPR